MQTSPVLIQSFIEKKRTKSLAAFYMLKANYGVFYKPTAKSLSMFVGVCGKTMQRYLADMEHAGIIEWQPNGNLRLLKTRYKKKFLFTVKIDKTHTLAEAEALLYGKMIECNCFAQAYTICKKRKDNASITNPTSIKMVKRRAKLLKNRLNVDGTGKLSALPVNDKIIYTFNKMCKDANISRSKASAVRRKLKEMNQVKFVKNINPVCQCGLDEFMQNRGMLTKEHGFVFWRGFTVYAVRPSTVTLLQRKLPSLNIPDIVENNETKTVITTTSSLLSNPNSPPLMELVK